MLNPPFPPPVSPIRMHRNTSTSQELSIINPSPQSLPGPDLLHELVQCHSDALAIDFLENGSKRRKFSYRTLHALSDALAITIVRSSTQLESASPVIPVLLPQCPEYYIVLLAVLKAGRAFCPLSLDTPVERLRFILGDLKADLVITSSAHVAAVKAACEVCTILVDRELQDCATKGPLELPRASTKDLAYVMYTSGSTGLPKAVSLSHRAVTQSLLGHDQHLPHFARFLQFAAPTFDVSVFEIFFPWFRGRTLVGCTRAYMLDDLTGTITQLGVDAAELTPTVVSSLLAGRSSVPDLKLLLTIGEMLNQHVIDEYGGNEHRESILWAMYGPTEAAIHCTLQARFSTSSSVGNIGYPLSTVSTFVIDVASDDDTSSFDILPIGTTGELAIGGAQVAREYLNRPDLTKSVFVEHPSFGRLYRTGDRARQHTNGTLECLGRMAEGQVKLRGQRIELGEIEQVIAKIQAIRTVAVVINHDTLIAFCVVSMQEVSSEEVLDICKAWLPAPMVPAQIYFIDSMPHLPSGKVDRKSLIARVPSPSNCHSEPEMLSDPTSNTVAQILNNRLGGPIPKDIALSSFGLDSLRAISIASALRQKGYHIGALDVLSATTTTELILLCERTQQKHEQELVSIEKRALVLTADDLERQGISQDDIEFSIRCTPLQEAMITETTRRPDAYCNWVELQLQARFTYDEIEDAVHRLTRANEILRTGFGVLDSTGAFIQLVRKELPPTQIQRVNQLSREFILGDAQSLLHPFIVQICLSHERPRLLLQIHHALYDGWSLDLMLFDLHKLLHGDQISQRPQFREITSHMTDLLLSNSTKAGSEYWAGALAGYETNNFPNYHGKIVSSSAPQKYMAQSAVPYSTLRSRAKELGVNPQVFFQAAAAYVLGLYFGTTDVVIGNVTSGRTIPLTGIEDTMGPCIASLPFRLRLEDLHTVRDILEHTQSSNRDSLHHSHIPLRDIARSVDVRPGSRLFEVLFVWQESLQSAITKALDVQVVDSADSLEFPVTLEYEPGDDQIVFRATFDTSIIPRQQVGYMFQQIDDVVQMFLANLDYGITDMNRCFRSSTLSVANPSPSRTRITRGPPSSVEKWALEDSERTAVVLGELINGTMHIAESLSYGTLNSRANQLARILQSNGVGGNDLVAIIMEKSIGLYVSILAVSKLGCGYLPLVPETPLERVKTILNDAKINICIIQASTSVDLRQELSTTVLKYESITLDDQHQGNLEVRYQGQNTAYAVFTSGSTGTPKGVLVTQDNLMSNLEYLATIYPYSQDSILLQSCSQAFDVSVFEIFFSWHIGICLCTAKKDDLFHDFEAAINQLKITHLSLTPTVAALVNPDNVPEVKFLVTAGEAVTESVKRSWSDRGLYQGYGPSETTNICTVRPQVTQADLINNIGRPFDNTSAFVLDPNSEAILPRGALGELCFGGSQVFSGYLNRPDLNDTKLIDLPGYGRIYRSGDTGRMLFDDSILFCGRSDDQIKLRGQRIELGEITSCVLDSPGVKDCITILYKRDHRQSTLVTFWVPTHLSYDSNNNLDPRAYPDTTANLFTSLSNRLPNYMIPSNLVPVPQIPMTAQAKVDTRYLKSTFARLPPQMLDMTSMQHGETETASEIESVWERRVANAIAIVLDIPVDRISRNSSFFNLGLDSVSAIRLCNLLRKNALGEFAVSQVLKYSTLAKLSSVSELARTAVPESRIPNGHLSQVYDVQQRDAILSQVQQQGGRPDRILPCTPLQQAMLADHDPDSRGAYSNVTIFKVNGELNRLKQCWRVMVQRHEVLRTSFISTSHPAFAFAQVVLEDHGLEWHTHDSSEDLRTQVLRRIALLLKANRPPVYFGINQHANTKKLIFGCHHALYDGSALAVLLEEVENMYHGIALSQPVKFDRYLQYMLSQDLSQADQFWEAAFEGFEPKPFPNLTGKLQGLVDHNRACQILKMPRTRVLRACQDMSVSLLAVLHANWARLLHFYTGEHDLCFGNIISGRTRPDSHLDRLVAPCFNSLPVRVNFDFTEKNLTLIRLAHAFNIDALSYELTPLRRIQKLVLTEGGRLFDTMVILQQPTKPIDSSIWTMEDDLGHMDVPIVCEILQNLEDDLLSITLHYDTTLLSEQDALNVIKTFDFSLESMLQNASGAANEIRTLPIHLRAKSNWDFQSFNTGTDLMHSGFERNAVVRPSAVALDFLHAGGGRSIWSFQKLNEIANDIAHRLLDNGVQVEDVVPIYMAKCPLYYAAILGVLKAGGTFTPVHPDLPAARKQAMLKDLRPKLILCAKDASLDLDLQGVAVFVVTGLSSDRSRVHDPKIEGLQSSHQAYCLFTSGSTGIPKAVSVEHRTPIQTIESARPFVPFTSSSRLLQYAAVTFDMCYFDCFLAWTVGITLCAASQHELLNDLPSIINTLGTDLLDLTPSVAVTLKRTDLPCVRWLYCIGEAMSQRILEEWGDACVNSYGPTEATFCTTIYQPEKDVKASVIGKPFPTTSFAIFAPGAQCELPILSVGELCIGGAQLARGYIGRPELTAERFLSKGRERFYRSGDMVRMLSNGNFEFLGRTDDQVKIRGLRVELGEINSVLQGAHPFVLNAVTQIVKRDSTAKEQLVVFIVSPNSLDHDQKRRIQQELKQMAIDRLPVYMVPSFFVFVEQLPKSMAGKIDKKALSALFEGAMESNELADGIVDEHMHNWTTLEVTIRDILAKLSRTETDAIMPETTIYHLGLDSISAVQIATALRKLEHNIQAGDVMRYMTCSKIAAFLERGTSTFPSSPPIDVVAFEERHQDVVLQSVIEDRFQVAAIRPCTPLQIGMISQFVAKEGDAYMNYVRLQLKDAVAIDKLRHAWDCTAQRHPILRTGFVQTRDNNEPFVMIQYTASSVILPWVDTSEAESIKADSWLHGVQHRVLTATHMPPWELRLVRHDVYTYLDIAIFHGLFDARSLQLILDDVAATYHGEVCSTPDTFDTILMDALYRADRHSASSIEFWTQLGKRIVPSRFPNLTPLRCNPMAPEIYTSMSSLPLSTIETRCKAANITLQAAGLASWLSIVSSYTGEKVVTCGIVLSGRDSEISETAVFPYINTVPIVLDVSRGRKDMLQQMMMLTADIQKHQFTSLPEIQRATGFANEPLFDTLFALQSPLNINSNRLWHMLDERASVEYPVSVELQPQQDQLQYRLTFLPHMIPKEHAVMILDQLDYTLNSLVTYVEDGNAQTTFDPRIYSVTPAKAPNLDSDALLLHELVEHSALCHPDRIAFEFATKIGYQRCESKSWTYSKLDAEGNRIAHLLIQLNIRPGNLVGVCFEKCPEASFAMLGILKAGCAFVAIDPGAPPARQAFIMEDARASAVLTMAAQSANFEGKIKVPIVNLDEVSTQMFPDTKPQLKRPIDPQDRSYCLYTSGTTGTPKGCELTHENAVQALSSFSHLFEGHWNSQSRWLQFASFHFDVSVLEQYWSWSVGMCVVSAPRDVIFEDLAASIDNLGITHIDLTPSLAQMLRPEDVPGLCEGVFITGGESLKQEILDIWGPKAVIYNGYGPTEATIGCTMYPRVPANGKPSNIGRQFPNVGTYVFSSGTDIPVLRGGIGELCVSGKLVGKGYLNRPELTNERFPFVECFRERVYRTGDLVRILHDESFEFLGRADDQIKLRGQRLEIGEINSVVKHSAENISDVATLVLKHPRQMKDQLVAFIVQGQKREKQPMVVFDHAEWIAMAKETCGDKLPPYMVPTHFVPLSSMPLNINNKADVRALRSMYESLSMADLQQLSLSSSGHNESWSPKQQHIRQVIAEKLGVETETVETGTSFFELGMDSISVIAVSQALKSAGFSDASASMLIKHSTVQRLSRALDNCEWDNIDRGSIIDAQQFIRVVQQRHTRMVAQVMAVDTLSIESLAPCTPLQQGMIARSYESDNNLYFNTFEFSLSPCIDAARLKKAWEHVFSATAVLRTSFVNTVDGYIQAVLARPLEWSTYAAGKQENHAISMAKVKQKWIQRNNDELKHPFEVVLLTSSSEQTLVVNIFHALYDGNSIELTYQAVWDAYNERASQSNAPSFHDSLVHGPLRAVKGAEAFWKGHLLPAARQGRSSLHEHGSTSANMAFVQRSLILPGFEKSRRSLKVTGQAFIQACWLSVLQRHTHVTKVAGIIVSGRQIDLEGAEGIVGPMFNTIPYYHNSQQGETWSSIINSTQNFNTSALRYQHTPLRDIQKWCKRSPGQPLFDNLFVYQVGQVDADWAENDAWTIIDGEHTADYPIALEVEQRANDNFQVTMVTQENYVSNETCALLLEKFEEALQTAIRDPQATPDLAVYTNGVSDVCINGTSLATNDINHNEESMWSETAIRIREEIAKICDVPVGEIQATTSIFELGLDSIDSIKLSSRLKQRDVKLPVSILMRSLTIAKMAEHVQHDERTSKESTPASHIAARKSVLTKYLEDQGMRLEADDEVLPATPLQEAMIADMVASDYTRYYNYDVLKLEPRVEITRLQQAWTKVIAASPILRTSFVEIDDPNIAESYLQVVRRHNHSFWSQVSVSAPANFQEIFDQCRTNVRVRGCTEPPFHVILVETPEQYHLVLAIAHALYDGWSLDLLHTDVQNAYGGCFVARPDFKPALDKILHSSTCDASDFWQDYLSGAKPSRFTDRLKVTDSNTVHRLDHRSKFDTKRVTSFAKTNNVSMQTVGQTAFAIVLASYAQSLDITFGSVLSGRNDEEASKLLFPMMNTVALRTIIHGTAPQMLRYMQDNFTSTKQWQHYPLRKALAAAGFKGHLFESLFIYQKRVNNDIDSKDKIYSSVEGHSEVEYPVCIEMEALQDDVIWRCAVKSEVFSKKEARKLLDQLDAVMQFMMDRPDASVIQVSSAGTSVCGLSAFQEKGDTRQPRKGKEHANSNGLRPLTPTAKTVRKVLAAVSKTSEDGITENMTIFHMGLDSINAIKVSSLLRKEGIILSVGDMLRAGSLGEMAAVADSRKAESAFTENDNPRVVKDMIVPSTDRIIILEQAGIVDTNVEEILPLSAGQLYMLSMWLNTQGATFYPEFGYDLHGEITFESLQSAWQKLAQANPMLRTTIVASSVPRMPYVQFVMQRPAALIQSDQSGSPGQNFNQNEPWAAMTVEKTSDGWHLRLKIHHVLYDGVSLPFLIQQFESNCCGTANASLPTSQVAQLIAHTYTETAAKARETFWTWYLQNTKQQPLSQPTSPPTHKTELYHPALLSTPSLASVARAKGISIQALFLACYAKIYATLTNSDTKDDDGDVTIGMYLANRSLPIPDIASATIPTVNLLPLCITSPGKHSIMDLAFSIQRDIQAISDPAHATTSLYEISKWTGARVDTFVNFLNLPDVQSDESKGAIKSGKTVKIEQVQEWTKPISRVTKLELDSSDVLKELRNEEVNKAYLHAIDIEATLRNNALDVGIFAPEDMLSLNAAEGMMRELKRELEGIS